MINKVHEKTLTADMANANGLQRAIRPTGFFNIKKMATDFCNAQCIMDNTGSLTRDFLTFWGLCFGLLDLFLFTGFLVLDL